MRMAGRQKGSKQIPYTHVLVQPSAPKSRYTFAYYSSETKAKAAQKKYEPLIGNPLRVIKQSGKSANTDIHESLWDNIRKRRAAGKPKLKPGDKNYPKTLNVGEEDNPRIPRKKGQPAGSDKHSDLYTDENPVGTIKGLGFKDVETAKASVAKIKDSGKTHAHKIQAAIAMEQRAKVMGKKAEAAVYRKFINAMKKKTKEMQKETTTTAAIPNPADTAMGPIDKKRKKQQTLMMRRFKEYVKTYVKEASVKHTHAILEPDGKILGFASDEKDAIHMSKHNLQKIKGKVVKLKKPMSGARSFKQIGQQLKND